MSEFNKDLELSIISCILQKPKLIDELYIETSMFRKDINREMVIYLKNFYKKNKNLDFTLLYNSTSDVDFAGKLIDFCTNAITIEATTAHFNEYQEKFIIKYKENKIRELINSYVIDKKINIDELIKQINQVNDSTLEIKSSSKVTAEEMISMIHQPDNLIKFNRFSNLNKNLRLQKNTVNVIAARPSEGKTALSINFFCDLAKKYKCIYFNMEMNETEFYERMLGIESCLKISEIRHPKNLQIDEEIYKTAQKIYNFKYEMILGSKTIQSIRAKILKEQRDEHLIVFIDYIGYIVGRVGETDRDRIGNAMRELNNMTKDYNCTIFVVAQINRNGTEEPSMRDLKDSGELEQTADTIILINDPDKKNNNDVKKIDLLIPKCRSGKRNIVMSVVYDKTTQRMED